MEGWIIFAGGMGDGGLPALFENQQVAGIVAHYRRYTEAILRRYLRMSLEAGRAPSLLGREMFRGQVTSYQVHSFVDVVIFVHDVENCLVKLDIVLQQQMIERVALQEYCAAGADCGDDGVGGDDGGAALRPGAG